MYLLITSIEKKSHLVVDQLIFDAGASTYIPSFMVLHALIVTSSSVLALPSSLGTPH